MVFYPLRHLGSAEGRTSSFTRSWPLQPEWLGPAVVVLILLSRKRPGVAGILRLVRRDCRLVAVKIQTFREGGVSLHDAARTQEYPF